MNRFSIVIFFAVIVASAGLEFALWAINPAILGYIYLGAFILSPIAVFIDWLFLKGR